MSLRQNSKLNFSGIVAGLGMIALISSCQPKLDDQTSQNSASQNSINNPPQSSKPTITKTFLPSFGLASVSAFSLTIEGCASGYTATLTESDTSYEIYQQDLNCLAKLTSFDSDGQTFTPKTGSEFTTWAVGEKAVFISGDLSTELSVQVSSQLSSPALVTDEIEYRITEILTGASGFNILRHSWGASGIVGDSPPLFQLSKSEMIDPNGPSGSARYVFTLECTSALANTGDPALVSCAGVQLANLEYVLVADVYDSQPCQDSTIATCESLVSSNTPRAVDTATADYIAPGTSGLTNGGFQTKTDLPNALLSPSNLAANPEMILIVRNTSTSSFQFFNFDIAVTMTMGAPIFDSLALANLATDHYINASESAGTSALASTLSGVNYSGAGFKLVSFATACDGALTYGASIPAANSADFSGDGNYKICVELTQAGYSPAYGASALIIRDVTVPNISAVNLANDVADAVLNQTEIGLNSVLVAVTSTGGDVTEYKITDSATTCDGALTYGPTALSGSSDIVNEGTYKVCVKLSDYAGNPTVYSSSPNFTVELPPVITSFNGANEASDLTVTNAEAGSTSPVVALVASGYTAEAYTAIISDSPAAVCDASQTYSNSTIPLINEIPPVNGDYVVCVRLTDSESQITYGKSQTITLDSSYVLPDLSDFSASASTTSNTPGSVDVSITYPPILHDIVTVEVYRVAGTAAPSNDCATGTLVHTFTNPVANGSDSIVDSGLTPESLYSYRACVKDNLNHVNTNEPVHIETSVAASYVHTIIVTSANYTGAAVGGISGADAKCQTAGDVLDNTLTWKALISDSGVDASSRIAVRGPIFNNDNPSQSPFSTASELWDAASRTLPYEVSWDETGANPNSRFVWTGTTSDGLAASNNCSDWSSTAVTGANGRTQRTGTTWLQDSDAACTNARHLYCVSQPVTAALDSFTAVTGSTARVIDLEIQFPLDTSEYSRVEVRRKQGSAAPGENCNTDTLVASLTAFSSWGPFQDDTGLSGGEFSYRVCIFDRDDIVARSQTITSVFAQGSVAAALSVSPDTTTATNGNVMVRVDYPTDISEIDRVEIRRTTGATGPSDCTAGSLVHTFNSPTSGGFEEWVDSGLTGDSYSYRACEYNASNVETAEPSNLIEDIRPSFMSWIFVSSAGYSGNLGGLSGADATCTTLGASLDSTVKWRAVLSDGSTSASTRFYTREGIWDTNTGAQTKIQTTMENLFSAGTALLSAVNYDETGGSAGNSRIWSGASTSGGKSGLDCNDWSDGTNGLDGTHGNTNNTGTNWISSGTRACSSSNRIMCMSLPNISDIVSLSGSTGTSDGEIDLVLDLPATTSGYDKVEIRRLSGNVAPDGDCADGTLVQTLTSFADWSATDSGLDPGVVYSYRACAFDADQNIFSAVAATEVTSGGTAVPQRIFASSLTYTGNLGGLSGADSKCQALAVAQSLGGNWKAILSTSSVNAKDRISIYSSVELLDGTTLVASDFDDLWDEAVTNRVNRDETNSALSGTSKVWTGTDGFGGKHANGTFCNNWTNSTTAYDGRVGDTTKTNVQWVDQRDEACDSTYRIMCIDGQ